MNAVAQGLSLAAGSRVLTSDQEHEGGSMCWRYLAHRTGVAVDVVPIRPGENDVGAVLDRFRAAITLRTRVISVSHVLVTYGRVASCKQALRRRLLAPQRASKVG